jgi:hypothetical protein
VSFCVLCVCVFVCVGGGIQEGEVSLYH